MPSPVRTERTKRVMVRLAAGGAPDEVLFTEKEYARVEVAAKRCKEVTISGFIRGVAVAAALATVHPGERWDDYQTIKSAANSANVPLGQWLRDVTLAGVKGAPTYSNMQAARRYVMRRYAAAK